MVIGIPEEPLVVPALVFAVVKPSASRSSGARSWSSARSSVGSDGRSSGPRKAAAVSGAISSR